MPSRRCSANRGSTRRSRRSRKRGAACSSAKSFGEYCSAPAHRSEAAFDWLLAIVAESRVPVALDAVEALAPYNRNAKLTQRLEAALGQRGERELLDRFAALWR